MFFQRLCHTKLANYYRERLRAIIKERTSQLAILPGIITTEHIRMEMNPKDNEWYVTWHYDEHTQKWDCY